VRRPARGVVARDLAYYRAAGVQGVSCLVFGRYSLWAYGLNVETFAARRGASGARTRTTETYCARRYGPAAAPMARYLDALARLTAAAVTHGDVLLPPDDVERAETVRLGLDAALREAPALRRLLAAAAAVCPSDAIAAEERLLDYTLAVLAAVRDWLGVRADTAAAERAIAAVLAAGQDVRDARSRRDVGDLRPRDHPSLLRRGPPRPEALARRCRLACQLGLNALTMSNPPR
jgi:hypothetical protein